jgi:hypothetical protein
LNAERIRLLSTNVDAPSIGLWGFEARAVTTKARGGLLAERAVILRSVKCYQWFDEPALDGLRSATTH